MLSPPLLLQGRGTGEAGGGAPPSALRAATSPANAGEETPDRSLPRLLCKPLVEGLALHRCIILASIAVHQWRAAGHAVDHVALRRVRGEQKVAAQRRDLLQGGAIGSHISGPVAELVVVAADRRHAVGIDQL